MTVEEALDVAGAGSTLWGAISADGVFTIEVHDSSGGVFQRFTRFGVMIIEAS